MKSMSALTPIYLLARYNQWAVVAFPVIFVAIFFLGFEQSFLPASIGSIEFGVYGFLVLVFLAVMTLLLLASFQIFRYFALLLKRVQDHGTANWHLAPETKKLRSWLIVQFLMNIPLFLSPQRAPPSEAEIRETLPAKTMALLDSYEAFSAPLGWLSVSLENSMPLVYLLVLTVMVKQSKESTRLREELNGVV